MSNNVRVLANDQIITSENQAKEQDSFLIFNEQNYSRLLQENAQLKQEKTKYYNESNYYKDRCIELFEKLQEHQIKVDINTMRVAE